MPAPARPALLLPRSSIRVAAGKPALAAFVALGILFTTGAAAASDYRRPGLEGRWSERHLTQPMNSLRILAGPGQPTLFGDRFGDQIPDGGGQYIRADRSDPTSAAEDEWWFRGGLSFGL